MLERILKRTWRIERYRDDHAFTRKTIEKPFPTVENKRKRRGVSGGADGIREEMIESREKHVKCSATLFLYEL